MSTGKKLRLMLFKECNRACPGCCNNTIDFESLPVCTDYRDYDEIMLTGGEPMLKPDVIKEAIRDIHRQMQHPNIYLYTALTLPKETLAGIVDHINGVTVTLHAPEDIKPFFEFDAYYTPRHQSMRLNIFKTAMFDYDYIRWNMSRWKIKKELEWQINCPLPEGEVLMRYAPVKSEGVQ